jgi:hypothetical protein
MSNQEWFSGTMPIGFPVLWYPNGIMDDSATPYVAFVTKGWSKGICDLQILPGQDGAVESKEQVYHAGDSRLRDSYGRLTPGATERGCWVPVQWMSLPDAEPKKKQVAVK